MTVAGRAADKHSSDNRSGSFANTSGNAAQKSGQAQGTLDGIVMDPEAYVGQGYARVSGSWSVNSPSTGRGAVFGSDGSFLGFREAGGDKRP